MAESIPADVAERRVIARTLKALREQRDLTQPQVAEAMGFTTQAYQKYESAERRFTPDKLSRLIKAIGATPEEFDFERARVLGRERDTVSRQPSPALSRREAWRLEVPIWGAGRMGAEGPETFDVGEPVDVWDVGNLLGPEAGSLQGVGESMLPWLEPGEMVLFNRHKYPQPNKGCVVELTSGVMLVKLYVRTDGSTLFVKQLNPPQTLSIPLSDVKGFYGVTLRGG